MNSAMNNIVYTARLKGDENAINRKTLSSIFKAIIQAQLIPFMYIYLRDVSLNIAKT